MSLVHIFKTAFKALYTHRSRTALTILGIVIGVTAIILVSSIGEGAQSMILGEIQSLGAKTIIVIPGKEPSGPTDPSIVETLYSDSLKDKEFEALQRKSNVPKLKEIMPIVFGVESVSYEGETSRPFILGASYLITDIFDIFPETGSFFTEDDIRAKAKVAIIGTKVKEELFGESEAIGQRIRVKNQNLKIIGVLPKKGQVLFFNADESVITPYTTAQQFIFGIKHFNRFIIEAESEKDITRTVEDIEATLRVMHNITNSENDDFFVETQVGITETLETVTGVLTLFLASVAAISLLVGGVGIMNVMLVSVTERTREIGLRKALGATSKNILIQFLIEAVTITALGGLVGVLLGASLSLAASLLLTYVVGISWTFAFPISTALLGLIVSMLIGIIFGLYPAYQASKKSPIEALRYE
jgi:putative ABC transport system permease protein